MNPITVEFTEYDHLTKGSYSDCDSCLLATALKRMGYENVNVGATRVVIGGVDWYRINDPEDFIYNSYGRPYRHHSVTLEPTEPPQPQGNL